MQHLAVRTGLFGRCKREFAQGVAERENALLIQRRRDFDEHMVQRQVRRALRERGEGVDARGPRCACRRNMRGSRARALRGAARM